MEALHQSNFGWPRLTFVTMTHILKIFKTHISEIIMATATLSCSHRTRGRWHRPIWLWPSQKWSNASTYFSGFRFEYPYPGLDLELSCLAGWQIGLWGSCTRVTLRDLTYFCDYNTELKKKSLKPIYRRWLQRHYRVRSYKIEDKIIWPRPSQKWPKRLDLLFGFSVWVCTGLDLERSYLAGWQMWGRELP